MTVLLEGTDLPEAAAPKRRILPTALTAAAGLLVWFLLVLPNQRHSVGAGLLVRVPVEGLALLGLTLVLPRRLARRVALAGGVLIGLLAVVKLLDMGYFEFLDRPFDPVYDWGSFDPAVGVLRDSVGHTWAAVLVVAAVLVAFAAVVLAGLATMRLTAVTRRHRRASARTLLVLGVVWAAAALLGLPVASSSSAHASYEQARQTAHDIADGRAFPAQVSATDSYRDVPAAQLLSGLRGKDVIIAFVESYGRVAVEGSSFAPAVQQVLTNGTRELRAAGFSTQSAFLHSPTFGGLSWLAHSTLQSGLWVNSQQRYDTLVTSQRFTLSDAFKKAGWRTVADVPANERKWPEGTSFYGYEQIYDETNVGYFGPKFGYSPVPDQFTLDAFRRLELARTDRAPVMAEIDLTSSHTPWAPLPRMLDWDALGDGVAYASQVVDQPDAGAVWRSANTVRSNYGKSVEYSMQTLISYVQRYGNDNTVLVVLGDHQPATIVSGDNATHDVPVSIIAKDPAVAARIASWQWQDGLLPTAGKAPEWRMDDFRNRFLDAFSG